MKLTILIPALNEEKTIKKVIEKAQKFIKTNNIDGEILVINNGSNDKTKDIALEMRVRVEEELKKGYGYAIRCGIDKANGEYIIMGDADDSYNFLELDDIYKSLINGNDFVIGNRYHHMEKGAMKFTHKYIGTPILNFLINIKYKVKIKDVNCGLRGFRKDKIQELNLKSTGMEIASEMIIGVINKKEKIEQVGINFYKDARKGKSHLKSIKDGLRHLNVIIKSKKM